ncbi:hypothetical protein CRV00_01060 [Malaciobacter molluscorum]|uniref:GGDEF domain-containing protein n=1 Tax=Malaciobacter molluscorum TaxID=1032072 RepID=UPI00100B1944|nr:GGDEF domain-containing protein [Malaciobacter molluscorum]RXJ97452.1 hypothetical protein CRV00_01060 [Malaciobacter molluscorum]
MISTLLKNFRHSIALHLLTTIFSVYFLVAVVVTVVQLYKEYEFPIDYQGESFEQKVILGQVTVYSNNQLVFDRVKYGFILILINSIIKTIALWFITYFFIKKYLGQPLEEFTTKIRKQDVQSPQAIDLNIHWTDTNELLILKDSYNQMIQRLNKHKLLSITDKLTGLFNRLKLDESLNDEFNRSNRFKRSFGIVILDIDHFKRVNDTYGHQVGDQVIIQFAKILKENIRKVDTLGRWGGEEFMIICSETDLKGTIKLAQSLREIIRKYDFPGIGNLSASFGVSIYSGDENIDSVIAHADNALYKAKSNGRNRVESE